MARATIFLVAVGLLVCSVYADDLISRYRIKSANLLYLEPSDNKTEISISTDAYLNQDGNSVSITLTNLGVAVHRENSEGSSYTSLSKCPATADLSMHRTFLAVLNDDGGLSHIKVDSGEDELSVNWKLFVASVLQHYRGQSPARGKRNELTYAGVCPIKNLGNKIANGSIYFNETSNMAECSEIVADRRGDGLACLSNTCQSSSKRQFEWISAVDARLIQNDWQIVMDKLILTMQASYNPFEYSNVSAYGDITTEVNLVSIGEGNSPVYQVNDGSEEVTSPRYKKINNRICSNDYRWQKKNDDDDDDEDLRQMYSALVCQQSFAAIYQDVVERILECNK